MAKPKKRKYDFPCRIEELPVIGGFLHDSFVTDKADFIEFSPDYDTPFLKNYEKQQAEAEEIINPKKLSAELKKITERLYANCNKLRPLLDRIERFAQKAADDLTIAVKDFGISAVRKKISSKDTEGLGEALKKLLKSVDDNIAELKAKGYKVAERTTIGDLQKAIKEDNASQNTKQGEKAKLVEDNIGVLNELWAMMQDIMKTGQTIYKTESPAKFKNYVFSQLKNKIRGEKKKQEGV